MGTFRSESSTNSDCCAWKRNKKQIGKTSVEKHSTGTPPNPDYAYCPKDWSDVYKNRRKQCGLALYNSLSIPLDDVQGRKKHWENNYHFFHAPIGLIVFIEKNMPVIFGTGQSGPYLAKRLCQRGYSVVVIEQVRFGGTCINYGSTPTKTLVANAKIF